MSTGVPDEPTMTGLPPVPPPQTCPTSPTDDTPVISPERGAAMVHFPPGRPVGRVDTQLVVRSLLCVATWSVTVTAIDRDLDAWWSAAASAAVLVIAMLLSVDVHACVRRSFDQIGLPGLFSWFLVTAGLTIGGGAMLIASLRENPAPFDLGNIETSPDFPRELAAIIVVALGVSALALLWRLVHSLRRSMARQARILQLRRDGTRHRGTLTAVTFSSSWLFDQPNFQIVVSYVSDGVVHAVPAFMRTDDTRVPVPGTAMVVLTDDRGGVHIELDHAAGVTFEPDDGRFRAPLG